LILGLFTSRILDFLNKKRKLLKYTIKAGGIILIIIGIMTYTGWMNGVSSYLNSITNDLISSDDGSKKDNNGTESIEEEETSDVKETEISETDNNEVETREPNEDNQNNEEAKETESEEVKVIPAIDFTLTDQYGNSHTLSDYKGKVVFLNFWATWCPPCRQEMPDIEKLYKDFNFNQDEVIILGVASPRSDLNTYTREGTKEEVIDFINENDYTFPILFDETGDVFFDYYVQSLPTTYFINEEGNIYGYYPGMMTESIMRRAIEDTINSTK
jgi:cytochrome c-type biogenesis protein